MYRLAYFYKPIAEKTTKTYICIVALMSAVMWEVVHMLCHCKAQKPVKAFLMLCCNFSQLIQHTRFENKLDVMPHQIEALKTPRGVGWGVCWLLSSPAGSEAEPRPETHFDILWRPQNAPICTVNLCVKQCFDHVTFGGKAEVWGQLPFAPTWNFACKSHSRKSWLKVVSVCEFAVVVRRRKITLYPVLLNFLVRKQKRVAVVIWCYVWRCKWCK